MKSPVFLNVALATTWIITSCSQSPVAPVASKESTWSVFSISDSFTGVSGSSSSDVYVLSASGTLLHYDGMHWSASMPFDRSLFWSTLWCVSPHDLFAVGYSRVFIDGGWHYDYRVHRFDGSVASPTNLSLQVAVHDLWGSSGSNVYAVGEGGLVLHFDGASWLPMESGTTDDILAIWGFTTGELFAVLEHSVLYSDGTSWREILTTTETLWDIWGSAPDDVYAVGPNGTVQHYDGANWTLTRLPNGLNLEIVFGFAANDVYVSGEHDPTYRFDGAGWSSCLGNGLGIEGFWGSSGGDVYAVGYGDDEDPFPSMRHFDGTSWNPLAEEHMVPLRANLTAISGNERELYAGGRYSTLFRHDGASWKLLWRWDSGEVSDIWAGPAQSLIAVAGGDDALVVDENGATQRRSISSSWSDYSDVWASGLNDVFFVGGAGHIAHFDGLSFQSMESMTAVGLNDVWGRSGSDVYAVGDGGTILHYDGQSWKAMESNSIESLGALWGNADMVVAVGSNGTILHNKTGQWVSMSSPSAESLTGVWGAASNDIYAAGPGVVLHFDGSRWDISSTTRGGIQVWGRAGDGLYMLETGYDGRANRILRHDLPPRSY